MDSLLINGMQGMGDNLHQRGIIRQLMTNHEVWLKTSWVSLYHDLIAQGLHVLRNPTRLRTQNKNQDREAAGFSRKPVPPFTPTITLQYSGHNVRRQPSQTILQAMCESAGMGISYADIDYRLPVPDTWLKPMMETALKWNTRGKRIMVYRPLVERPSDWAGAAKRNADPDCYAQVLRPFRDQFFIVSVADLAPGREWTVGPVLKADVEFHGGELSFEQLAALFSIADVVYTSSGFATILAPAVGTDVISITGGYERAQWHESGAKFAGYLGIESDTPCSCATSSCPRQCAKKFDVGKAIHKIGAFLKAEPAPIMRPTEEMFRPSPPINRANIQQDLTTRTGQLAARRVSPPMKA